MSNIDMNDVVEIIESGDISEAVRYRWRRRSPARSGHRFIRGGSPHDLACRSWTVVRLTFCRCLRFTPAFEDAQALSSSDRFR